jgi:hypothetical protein
MEDLKAALVESQRQREEALAQWQDVKKHAASRRKKLEAARDLHKSLSVLFDSQNIDIDFLLFFLFSVRYSFDLGLSE